MKNALPTFGWILLALGGIGCVATIWQIQCQNAQVADAALQFAEAEQLGGQEQAQEWQQVLDRAESQTEQRVAAAQRWRELGRQEMDLRRKVAASVPDSAGHSDLTKQLASLQAERKSLATQSSPATSRTNQSPTKNVEDQLVQAQAQARLTSASTRLNETLATAQQRLPILTHSAVASGAMAVVGVIAFLTARRQRDRA